MGDHIVVDVEIKRTIEETPGGWGATDKLGVAVAVVYSYNRDRYRVFGDTLDEFIALRSMIRGADRITGFNTFNFDFPVIFEYPKKEWLAGCEVRSELEPKSNDLLRRIWQSLGLDPDSFSPAHGGWSLQNVVKGTLGSTGKIGHGANAPKWYQAGEWGKVVNYCVDDVSLERELSEFIDKYGYVINGKTGQKLDITV